jgi:hypothetical protein
LARDRNLPKHPFADSIGLIQYGWQSRPPTIGERMLDYQLEM